MGYSLSAALLAIGVYKLFDPEAVGFWADKSGESVVIGALAEVPAGTHGLLGWWITPIAVGLGIAATYLATRLLRVLKVES